MQITLPQSNDYALDVSFRYRPGWEQWVLLTSDIHHDSPECLEGLLKEHLELAKSRNAVWVDLGDLFDVINSANDRRGGHGGVKPQHDKAAYLDAVVDDLVDWFAPYADMLIYAGRGNHDAKMVKLHNTDILRTFVKELNQQRKATRPAATPIHLAGYGGWIVFRFEHASGGLRSRANMFNFHGVGGGGEVTKGTMEAQRMAATVSNADLVVTGHIHEKWHMELVRTEVAQNGRVRFRPRDHVKLASYKQDYRLDYEPTWHMQRPGGTPKPLGGKFIRFFCDKAERGVEWEIRNAPVDYRNLR